MTAIALKIPAASAFPSVVPARRLDLRRVPAHHWDLFAVLSLLGSSAVCAVGMLLHLA